MYIIITDKENEKKKADTAKAGWWGWLSGSAPASGTDESDIDDETGSIHMTDEQKKELYDAIEYDEDKVSIASAVDVPKDVSIAGTTILYLVFIY